MIRQGAISLEAGETHTAVTSFSGVAPLANLVSILVCSRTWMRCCPPKNGANQDEAVKQTMMAGGEDVWQRVHLCSDPEDSDPCVRERACETVHAPNHSARPRRLLVVRRERLQDDLLCGPYVCRALITNMALPLGDRIARSCPA